MPRATPQAMPKKSRRRVNQTGEGDGRSRQDDNNNEGAVGDFDDLERVHQMQNQMREMIISSLGDDGYDEESLKRLDQKMRDYYLEEDDFYYVEYWCQHVKNSNTEKPTEDEIERYKKSTIIRLRCLRNASGPKQVCNFLGGEAYKNIDLYEALYDDLVSYYYIWFEIIFNDGTTNLHSACATMMKFASVKLEMGARNIDELIKIMYLLDEIKGLYEDTISGDVEASEDAAIIEYDWYVLCYKFAIELTKANKDHAAEDYFETAMSAETFRWYDDMHCRKLLEFATARDLSENQQLQIVHDYAMLNYGFFFDCLRAYVNNQKGSVRTHHFDDLRGDKMAEKEEEENCNNCGIPSGLLEMETGKKLLRCTRCKIALYCSKECQKADWKRGHRKGCSST